MKIQDLTLKEKREALIDWIQDMDEFGLDECLKDFLGFEDDNDKSTEADE